MPADNVPQSPHGGSSRTDDVPQIEDAHSQTTVPEEEVLEDDLELLESSHKPHDADVIISDDVSEEGAVAPSAVAAVTSDKLETSDVATVPDELEAGATPAGKEALDWDYETSAHRIIIELKRIESEVRQILEARDSKRKRKLAGSRRWQELEEDLVAWHYSGRFDEPTLRHLRQLVARRHYLFRRLRFIAGTRPTWNT